MRKFILFLLWGSLILLLIGCQPTTTSPDVTKPEPTLEIEAETVVPNPSIEPTETETAVPEATIPPTPTRIAEFTAEPLPTISLEEQPMPSAPSNAVKLSPEAYPAAVDSAVQDLAQRLNVDASEIEIISVEMVIWPDASMGCPHPDMAYTQVPKDGLLIRLAVNGQIYNYHSGGARDPFLCEPQAKDLKPSEELLPPPGNMDT